MRKQEGRNWNSEPLFLGVVAKPNVGVARKLEDISHSLTLPEEQGKVVEFLTNTGNAQRINDMVEGVHEALMNYQVCKLDYTFSTMTHLHARHYCNRISSMRVVSSL